MYDFFKEKKKISLYIFIKKKKIIKKEKICQSVPQAMLGAILDLRQFCKMINDFLL